MNNNGEERTDILVLVDEDGNEHDFALVDRFQVNLHDYAILVPVVYFENDDEGEERADTMFWIDKDGNVHDIDMSVDLADDAYIFRIEVEGEEETLVEVDDEAEWNEVAAVWEVRAQGAEYEDEDDEDLF